MNYSEPKAEIVTASQMLVDHLLSLNVKNRAEKPAWIRKLTSFAKSGEFILTNQGIGICADGYLIDGQNRLMAIRDAGYPPVQFVLVTGLSSKAQTVVDTGFKRTLVDLLKLILDKPSVAQIKASACRVIWLYNDDLCSGDDELRSIAQFMDTYQDDIDSVVSAMGSKGRAAIIGALIEFSIYCGNEKALTFAHQVKTGEGLFRHDPAFRLRDHISRNKSGGEQARKIDRQLAISACTAFYEGRDLQALKPSEAWPVSIRRCRK